MKRARPLTDKQRVVLALIAKYYTTVHQPCTVTWLAAELKIGRTAVMAHLRALDAKQALPPAAAPRVNLNPGRG